MSVIRLIAPALVCAALATPASTDVTLRLKGSGHMFGTEAQDSTEYRKGLKLRTDWTSNGVTLSSIIDLGTGRTIMLWHDSKTANVTEPRTISESLARTGVPEVEQSITPTAQSRRIAGSTCIVHTIKASFPVMKMEMVPAMTIVTQVSMCLVKNGPGQADFTAFYRAILAGCV